MASSGERELIVYAGFLRETKVKSPVERVDEVAGRIDCMECGGTGHWNFGPPGTEGMCVNCKGVGKQYVSI